MFTGLIEEVGLVQRVRRQGGVTSLAIKGADAVTDLSIGDSIAVDGTCLTVTTSERDVFEVELSDETLARTTLSDLGPADRVNLERPCRVTDRIGGHIVTGHIDGVGTILEIRESGGMWWFSFSYPESLRPLLVQKGSVAVDGISLTVAGLCDVSFGAAVIPHTHRRTTLGHKQVGQRVNLETDLLGKYVIRYLEDLQASGRKAGLTESVLREWGYI
ncbi:MAG TPA: riboflavin synthase [Candidatus Methylomirabilis sp.]|nr:riboflavin synthase [Candidatus Methylomirabilis sp.]